MVTENNACDKVKKKRGISMKLDKRIIDRKYIFDVFNADKAKEFIGEDCYMTNDIELFKDLGSINVYKLNKIEDGFFYDEEEDEYFNFCLPIRWLNPEEKSYRPYTLREFLSKFPMLTTITMRERGDNDCIVTCTFTGYRTRLICIDVCLGVEWVSLGTLADKYEYKNTLGDWLPFGVEL